MHGPIFIGGLDQSGKTLLRLSLSAHPHIAMSRRTYMWPRFYGRYGDLRQHANFERCLTAMLRQPSIRALKPNPNRIRREFGQGEPTYARLFALFHQHYAEQIGKPRWGDQLGLIERYADPIFAAYPAAKMIHMLRDPRDRYKAAVAPARRWRGKVGEATARWVYSAGLAQRNQRRYPDRYLVVRYETFHAERENTLRRICTFLDEPFAPHMLTLTGAIRFGSTSGARIDQELNQPGARSAATTQAALPKRELAFMQTYAKQAMAAYNYAPEPIDWSVRDRLLFALVEWPADVARMVAWRAFESRRPDKG